MRKVNETALKIQIINMLKPLLEHDLIEIIAKP